MYLLSLTESDALKRQPQQWSSAAIRLRVLLRQHLNIGKDNNYYSTNISCIGETKKYSSHLIVLCMGSRLDPSYAVKEDAKCGQFM